MPGLVGSDLSEFAVAEAGKWRHQQSSESSESSESSAWMNIEWIEATKIWDKRDPVPCTVNARRMTTAIETQTQTERSRMWTTWITRPLKNVPDIRSLIQSHKKHGALCLKWFKCSSISLKSLQPFSRMQDEDTCDSEVLLPPQLPSVSEETSLILG